MTHGSGCHNVAGGGIHGGEAWARVAGCGRHRLGKEGMTDGPRTKLASAMVGRDGRMGVGPLMGWFELMGPTHEGKERFLIFLTPISNQHRSGK
jgi:hypothetical protein